MRSNWKTLKFTHIIVALASLVWLTACNGQAPTPAAGVSLASTPTAAAPAPAETPIPTALPAAATPAPAAQAPASTCKSPAALTPELTEGPYFKANSPERASLLEAGMAGTKLVLTGAVFTSDCQPVAHALLDFWQADASGQYDNTGYTLRGHQYADAAGHYQLTTVVPGLYPGRTEHIHLKVQAPGGPIITSQLFFPGVPNNDEDGIFDPKMVLAVQETSDGLTATFDFVVKTK
jgi:protocatechuate 3,4-dioxygenase beta subunit